MDARDLGPGQVFFKVPRGGNLTPEEVAKTKERLFPDEVAGLRERQKAAAAKEVKAIEYFSKTAADITADVKKTILPPELIKKIVVAYLANAYHEQEDILRAIAAKSLKDVKDRLHDLSLQELVDVMISRGKCF